MNKDCLIQEILEGLTSVVPLTSVFRETEEASILEEIEMELESVLGFITLLNEILNEQN